MPLRNNINLSAGMPGVWNRAPRAAQKYWSLQRVEIPGLSPVCMGFPVGRKEHITFVHAYLKILLYFRVIVTGLGIL